MLCVTIRSIGLTSASSVRSDLLVGGGEVSIVGAHSHISNVRQPSRRHINPTPTRRLVCCACVVRVLLAHPSQRLDSLKFVSHNTSQFLRYT